jgi:hypothetical protein
VIRKIIIAAALLPTLATANDADTIRAALADQQARGAALGVRDMQLANSGRLAGRCDVLDMRNVACVVSPLGRWTYNGMPVCALRGGNVCQRIGSKPHAVASNQPAEPPARQLASIPAGVTVLQLPETGCYDPGYGDRTHTGCK